MTDLEITKLCAEAMGYTKWGCHLGGLPGFTKETGVYDPVHDDAQAMALVKNLKLDIGNINGAYWVVTEGPKGSNAAEWTKSDDLNRAICECVAKMQAEKGNG